jgi:hypothetical protein
MTDAAARDGLLRRIRACLALADSPEPHEAAAALRQADALMRKHGLSETDVELSAVREEAASIGRGRQPAAYLASLAHMVASVMGCDLYARGRAVVFVGVGPGAEVAAYSYQVLGRQLVRDRALYRKRRTRGAAHTRTARADAWALGWVGGVRRLVEQVRPPRPAVVDRYMAARHADLPPARPSRIRLDSRHVEAGWWAGRTSGVRLHHGVAPGQAQPRIGH